MNFLPDNFFKELNFNFVVIIFGPHLGSIYILELSFMLGSNSADLQPIVFLSIAESNSNSAEVLHYCNIQYCNRSALLRNSISIVLQ